MYISSPFLKKVRLKKNKSWYVLWWLISVVPPFGKLKQEASHEFKFSLSYK